MERHGTAVSTAATCAWCSQPIGPDWLGTDVWIHTATDSSQCEAPHDAHNASIDRTYAGQICTAGRED